MKAAELAKGHAFSCREFVEAGNGGVEELLRKKDI
jgi:hypothetical protein